MENFEFHINYTLIVFIYLNLLKIYHPRMSTIIQINSISQLHDMLNLKVPKHPLITIINVCDLEVKQEIVGVKVVTNLYSIALKDVHCGLEYGRTNYDF